MLLSCWIWRRRLFIAWYRSALTTPKKIDADSIIVCGSLADDERDRPMRQDDYCECKEGWAGINCNVCTENKACNALMPHKEGGVCYQNGEVVHENYQMCDITNRNIVKILDGRRPQVTFSCNAKDETCAFQCKYFLIKHAFCTDNTL